eukprot:9923070-Lingulodinium_polyedra.AAC.1
MLQGVAKAQIAEDWTNTTGEGVPIQEDKETCAKVHEAMDQAMNAWNAFAGCTHQVAKCWATDYHDT